MLGDAHYEAALNYFYFITMDESAAVLLALKTIQRVQKKIKNDPRAKIDEIIIQELAYQLRKKHSRHFLMGSAPPKSDWIVPNIEVYSKWKSYLRHADVDSAEALVLHYILKFSVTTMAQALNCPEGTIYFRLGKGLEAFAGDSL